MQQKKQPMFEYNYEIVYADKEGEEITHVVTQRFLTTEAKIEKLAEVIESIGFKNIRFNYWCKGAKVIVRERDDNRQYITTAADDTQANNLDSLPEIPQIYKRLKR